MRAWYMAMWSKQLKHESLTWIVRQGPLSLLPSSSHVSPHERYVGSKERHYPRIHSQSCKKHVRTLLSCPLSFNWCSFAQLRYYLHWHNTKHLFLWGSHNPDFSLLQSILGVSIKKPKSLVCSLSPPSDRRWLKCFVRLAWPALVSSVTNLFQVAFIFTLVTIQSIVFVYWLYHFLIDHWGEFQACWTTSSEHWFVLTGDDSALLQLTWG